MIRLHSPCHRAFAEEQEASRQLKTQNATQDDALKALQKVDAGLDWNEKACGSIASKSPEEKEIRGEMYLLNKAFLLSLRGEAEQVLGRPSAARSFGLAKPLLLQCANWKKLPSTTRANCRTQLADNVAAQRPGSTNANDPCQVALTAANDAGEALRGKDTASFERAYRRSGDGLAANKNCRTFPQMKLVNDAYLRSYKPVADRDLNIPFSSDSDIANPADPFRAANDELAACGRMSYLPGDAAANCRLLLTSNANFAKTFAEQDARSAGPALPTLAWPYPIRTGFVWDAPGHNAEHQVFADEESRGTSGWNQVAKGTDMRLADHGDWVLFAAIRNWEDLHTMFDFTAATEPFGRDFFNTKMLLIAVQHKPDQQCDIRVNSVGQIVREATATPAVRVEYALTCQPPGATANTVVKVIQTDKTNGQVSFVEDGGTGPSGYAPAVSR